MEETSEPRLGILPVGMELSTEETKARLTLLAALLGSKPVATSQDLEVTGETYLNLTADIPLRWLTVSVRWHLLDPSRFGPSIGEVKTRAMTEFLRSMRSAKGLDPDRGNNGQVVQCSATNVDHWIGVARKADDLPEIPSPTSTVVALPEGWEKRIDGMIESMARSRKKDDDDED